MYKVLLTDDIAREALEVFQGYPEVEATACGTLTREELARRIPEFDAIIIRSPTRLSKELIAAGKKLKFIGRAGVGVDNIDVDEATARGITVMNSPGGNTISTAEHTIGMILALVRKIPQADRSVRDGKWDRRAFRGVELHGKTLGVIGFGRVGSEVARRMLAFGVNVVAVDPNLTPEKAAELGVERVDLDTLLGRSHFITIHVGLGGKTRGLISDGEIKKMRDGVYLVNCARGGVVDEGALQRAIEAGKIAGVALDVYEKEPPGAHPLLAENRAVFTPHVAAATPEAQVRVAVQVAINVADALTKGVVRDAVTRIGGR